MKAVVFDIGQTLAYYPFPLNWSALYRPVFESIAVKLDLQISEEEYEHIAATLSKYNAAKDYFFSNEEKDYGQDYTISRLDELFDI